jgi:hypothetical protein
MFVLFNCLSDKQRAIFAALAVRPYHCRRPLHETPIITRVALLRYLQKRGSSSLCKKLSQVLIAPILPIWPGIIVQQNLLRKLSDYLISLGENNYNLSVVAANSYDAYC